MRTLLSLMLAIFSLPVAAEELQFNLSGLAGPGNLPGPPTIPFEVLFTLNTLSGSSSFSFSYPQPCLTAWKFTGPATGANITNFTATVGGQKVLDLPFQFADGDGGVPLGGGCSLFSGFIFMTPLVISEMYTQDTRPLKLNQKDPLADLLTHSICHQERHRERMGCTFGFLNLGNDSPGYFLQIERLTITRVHSSVSDAAATEDDSEE